MRQVRLDVLIIPCLIIAFATNKGFAQLNLTLDDCRTKALENNKAIAIAREEIAIAGQKKKSAFAAYFPKLDANATYLYSGKDISLLSEDKLAPVGTKMSDGSFGLTPDQVNNQWTIIDGNPVPLDGNGKPFNPKANPEKIEWKGYAYLPKEEFTVDVRNNFLMGFSLLQPLYLGGKVREMNKITGYAESIANYQLNGQQIELLYETEERYWSVVSLSNKLQLAESYKKLLIQLEQDVQAMFDEGVVTKNDLLKIKVRLNEVEMLYTKAENGLQLTKMALCQLIGLPINSNIKLEDEELKILTATLPTDVNIQNALNNRHELKTLDELVKMSQAKLSISKGNMLPNAALMVNYSWMNPNPYNGFEKTFGGNLMVGVTLQMPIFHWGEKHHAVNVAKSEQRIAELKKAEAGEKIELQINQAIFKINEANKNLEVTNKNMQQAEENLRYANVGFEEGVVGITSILEAQVAWHSANSERIDAQIDAKMCNVYLKKASGNLLNEAK